MRSETAAATCATSTLPAPVDHCDVAETAQLSSDVETVQIRLLPLFGCMAIGLVTAQRLEHVSNFGDQASEADVHRTGAGLVLYSIRFALRGRNN